MLNNWPERIYPVPCVGIAIEETQELRILDLNQPPDISIRPEPVLPLGVIVNPALDPRFEQIREIIRGPCLVYYPRDGPTRNAPQLTSVPITRQYGRGVRMIYVWGSAEEEEIDEGYTESQ